MEDDEAPSVTKSGIIIRTIYDSHRWYRRLLVGGDGICMSFNPNADAMRAYGQELNPESYAICKVDMLIKGQEVGNISLGNTLSTISFTPPSSTTCSLIRHSVSIGKKKKTISLGTAEKGFDGRFGAGLPRVSDGSLLFLLPH